jgi:hypothetical protein
MRHSLAVCRVRLAASLLAFGTRIGWLTGILATLARTAAPPPKVWHRAEQTATMNRDVGLPSGRGLAIPVFDASSGGVAQALSPASRLGPLTRSSSMKWSSILTRAVLTVLVMGVGGVLVWLWNTRPALAAGASQNEKVVICTGDLDSDGEVVYVLDTLTGDLKAFTMHQSGKFSASYYRNVMSDFGLDKSKAAAQFTMVAGRERFARRGTATPINSVLYVAEATSGKMAAYTLTWTSAYRQKLVEPGAPGSAANPAPIVPLDGVQYRANVVRMPVSGN